MCGIEIIIDESTPTATRIFDRASIVPGCATTGYKLELLRLLLKVIFGIGVARRR